MDAIEVTARHRQISPDRGANRQHDGVVTLLELSTGDLDANLGSAMEVRALIQHLPNAAVQHRFLHLELGNAIAQQSPRSISPLEDRNGMPGSGELLGGC